MGPAKQIYSSGTHSNSTKHRGQYKTLKNRTHSYNHLGGNSASRSSSNTAHVVVVSVHQNVTVVTPASAPTVLDSPVRSTVFGAITDTSDGVVQSAAAASVRSVNTARVELEADSAGIDGNTDDTLFSNGGLEIRFGVLLGGTAVVDGTGAGALWVTGARSLGVTGNICVVVVVADTAVEDDVVESVVDPTTVAGHVVVWAKGSVVLATAIDELLLCSTAPSGTVLGAAGAHGSLKGGTGAERPAGTARSLVLDGGDLDLRFGVGGRSPVNRVWESVATGDKVGWALVVESDAWGLLGLGQVLLSELGVAEVGKLVHGYGVGLTAGPVVGVVSFDKGQVFLGDGHSAGFLSGGIALAKSGLELVPFGVKGSGGGRGRKGRDSDQFHVCFVIGTSLFSH